MNRRQYYKTRRLNRCCLVLLLAACWVPAAAQTLFTYGKHAVSRDEFLKAYRKNYPDTGTDRLGYEAYLDLYATFRIKVQAALDLRMDTLPDQRTELESFRQQLAENHLRDDASVDMLVKEAMKRSLKDIRVLHAFIPLEENADAGKIREAESTIEGIRRKMQAGQQFGNAATPFGVKDLGYITAFVLPYAFESAIYDTPPNKQPAVHRSATGFHLFFNAGERKAVGKIVVAQILLAYPPAAGDTQKQATRQKADSVYRLLKNGADFTQLATAVSDDNLTYQAGGMLPAFGVGHYEPSFEQAAFALQQDGDISLPFATSFGYHILKRIQRIPVVEDLNQPEWKQVIRERVTMSDRMQVANTLLVHKIRQTISKDATPAVLETDSATLAFYRQHLEKYNPEFAEQVDEFRKGNLLFAVMQKQVWDAAVSDSTALRLFYNRNQDRYYWENSADAIVITCSGPSSVTAAQTLMRNHPDAWRSLADSGEARYVADSGRFELAQLPIPGRTTFKVGLITAAVQNEPDSSRSFCYIVRLYPQKERKKFEEAKGIVINDYQAVLEREWLAALKRKYPIKVNRSVFRTLPAVTPTRSG